MAAPNEITGVQKSITGRATMKSDRNPHYLRQSAFICGLDLVFWAYSRSFAVYFHAFA